MNARFALAALAAACLSTFAAAQMGQGMGPGPGMRHGQGPGPGPGAGMMGGRGGCDMGQGMTGGAMMGRHGGMGGMGGMGGAMMGGLDPAALEALNLSEEQRGKVREAQRDLQRKRHALMGSMHELRWEQQDAARAARFDEAAARKNYDASAAIRKQMFEAGLEARTRIEAVLTKEQREQLRALPRRPGPA